MQEARHRQSWGCQYGEFIVRFVDDPHRSWAVPLADEDPEEFAVVPDQSWSGG
jgi:hypothetical protein